MSHVENLPLKVGVPSSGGCFSHAYKRTTRNKNKGGPTPHLAKRKTLHAQFQRTPSYPYQKPPLLPLRDNSTYTRPLCRARAYRVLYGVVANFTKPSRTRSTRACLHYMGCMLAVPTDGKLTWTYMYFAPDRTPYAQLEQ